MFPIGMLSMVPGYSHARISVTQRTDAGPLLMVLAHLLCTVPPLDVGQWINVSTVWADRRDGRLTARHAVQCRLVLEALHVPMKSLSELQDLSLDSLARNLSSHVRGKGQNEKFCPELVKPTPRMRPGRMGFTYPPPRHFTIGADILPPVILFGQ